jgi:ubiquinone/menaquinone biosynthesis C-methylase UbiE
MTTMTMNYRLSHAAVDKGLVYDNNFEMYTWRRYLWRREQAALKQIINEFLPEKQIDHLDFACGTGRILGALKPFAHTSVGVDVSSSMLEQCRKKNPDAEIYQTDLTCNNTLAGRQFNLITAFRFFPNAEPALRHDALDAMAWHLEPDGILVFNNHKNASSVFYQLSQKLGRHCHTMHNREINTLLDRIGFEIVKVFGFGALPANDRHTFCIPSGIHLLADWCVNGFGFARTLCQDTIFVCRKKSADRVLPDCSGIQNEDSEMLFI